MTWAIWLEWYDWNCMTGIIWLDEDNECELYDWTNLNYMIWLTGTVYLDTDWINMTDRMNGQNRTDMNDLDKGTGMDLYYGHR